MSDGITLDIPVKKYVAKYLEKHIPLPYVLSLNDDMGVFLYSLLRNPKHDNQYKNIVDRYSGRLPVIVSENYLFDEGCRNVNAMTSVNINTFLEHHFKKELWQFVMMRTALMGFQQKKSIIEFMELYGISEDDGIGYDGLKKSIERMNDKKYKLSFLFWRTENQSITKQASDLSLGKKVA